MTDSISHRKVSLTYGIEAAEVGEAAVDGVVAAGFGDRADLEEECLKFDTRCHEVQLVAPCDMLALTFEAS